ncbi:response regulator [Streptomyces mangrovisoli]|uniref:DNA-binding response regulator n=1 Tax=Streptomyces mangrovisoli TaxID=1428628 RepID=A0A1J4NMM1_9ACTN|nr:response regulator transcription factor [Streptomyces mangrovisoli]OIJ63583.1 DNA-binding response regulator [Streptomyces mangrovisoli]
MTIRVLIADDQDMVRAGFRLILEREDDIDVVAEAADGREALELARDVRPDVCLLDIRMPAVDGLEVTRRLNAEAAAGGTRAPRIVVVTTFDQDEYVHTALRNGAVGFLLKNSGPALLVEAVRAAVNGESLIAPAVTVRLLSRMTDRGGPPKAPAQPLTDRERQVVALLARGATNQELASALHLSLSTVKTHLSSVQTKLGARNRVEIAAWAWESGLVPPAPGGGPDNRR